MFQLYSGASSTPLNARIRTLYWWYALIAQLGSCKSNYHKMTMDSKYIYIYINENYLPYCIKLSASKGSFFVKPKFRSDIPFIWIVLNVLVLFPCHRCYSWMFLWLFIPEVKIGCVWSNFLGIPLLLNGKEWYFPWYRELSAI